MAEINVPSASPKRGGSKGKKLSTRVDLTPMVDLGFLLITFFMFTSSLKEKKVMKLGMPASGPPMPIALSTVITIIPTADKIFYYHGDWKEVSAPNASGFATYSVRDGIGEIIRKKQDALNRYKNGRGKDMMVIIKPDSSANYKEVLNVLDEMLINEVASYAVTDISEEEAHYIKTKRVP